MRTKVAGRLSLVEQVFAYPYVDQNFLVDTLNNVLEGIKKSARYEDYWFELEKRSTSLSAAMEKR